jgi:uncharacterized protein (TIGR03437 family)
MGRLTYHKSCGLSSPAVELDLTSYALRALPFCMAVTCLHAQDTRNVTEPVFPAVCTTLAAQLSAGPLGLPAASETLFDTARIQSAMNACAAGQAVELQASESENAYLIGPIQLVKGVTLLVDAGVTVYGSRNPRDYDATSSQTCGTLTSANTGCVPLITANRADGAGIIGYGVIDGRGELPMLINGTPSGITWWDLARSAATGSLSQNNPRMLQVSNTNNFTLYKITLMNSPNFHVALGTDTNFTAWGIKIITPYDARNTDGIDPGYSSNVTIANCYISDGDDNVAVGGSNSPGASNISVVNDHFGDGHGASIGSYTQAGVSNILFDHITFAGDSTNSNAAGVRIKTDISRGGLVQNVMYSNLCMHNVHDAIVLDPFYTAGATGTLIPQFKNITLQNVHATTEGTVTIEGHDASVPTSITLNNVQVDGIKSSDLTESYVNYTLGPDPVNFASLLKGTGVTVTNNVANSNPPYSCPASVFSPVAGELIPGPSQIPAGQTLNVLVQVITTKAVPYQTYLTNLKANPNATLALTAPAGTVTILDGGAVVGTGTLSGSPMLSIPVAGLASGPHSLTASYSGDSNYAGISFGNYPLTVGGAVSGVPSIAASGVVNAASFASGIVAQGSLFSIFGTNLGSTAPVQASSFPLNANLGGTSVEILQGGMKYDAWLLFASSGQVNAILPSSVPAGIAQVTVTYNGMTSQPASFTIVKTSFGVFFQTANGSDMAVAQNYVDPANYPLNLPATPARPGQIVLVWGTGLGPIPAPDNLAPGAAAVDLTDVPVTILVGGIQAQRLYAGRQAQSAGVDNVYFTVPAGVANGCQVPVVISAAGVAANTTTIAVTADGSACQ